MDRDFLTVTKQPILGSTISNYVNILYENKFDVDMRYLPRMVYAALMTCAMTPLQLVEEMRYEKKIENAVICKSPIFIIGHWRSGTTFLHNLLAHDECLGYMSNFQSFMPSTSIFARRIAEPIVMMHLPKKRPMDDVCISAELPQEEEFAMANLSTCSYYHAWCFPKRMKDYFRQYILFEGISDEEIRIWKKTYEYLFKKISLQSRNRRLVFKNPANTGRVKYLLELFPDAKFIYIYRNPYEVFLSTVRLYEKMIGIMTLQKISREEIVQNVLAFYPQILEKFFNEKRQIPKGHIVQMKYEQFIDNPLSELKRIYDELSLDGFEGSKERFARYVSSQSGFRCFRYNIDDRIKELVDSNWGASFQRHMD